LAEFSFKHFNVPAPVQRRIKNSIVMTTEGRHEMVTEMHEHTRGSVMVAYELAKLNGYE
jgi:hypothetical protein